MSDEFYPVGLIESVRATPHDRTIKDDFEDGGSASRRFWGEQSFKRRIEVIHSPLTHTEFRRLRSFYAQRGTHDSFWFRDNVGRMGNAKVRFAAPLPFQHEDELHRIRLDLEEVAPVRSLPEFDQVAAAAGAAPLFWWDANRERYQLDEGAVITDPAVYDAYGRAVEPVWQSGSLGLGNSTGQYQHYAFDNSRRAATSGNVSLSGTQPAFTLFCLVNTPSHTSFQLLAGVGNATAQQGLGLIINDVDEIEPWTGDIATWTGVANSPADTWRSAAVSWPSASNAATLTINGSASAAGSNTRSYVAGPARFGSVAAGSLIQSGGKVAHVMAFASELTLTQIKALHNLFAHQYGLSLV